MVSLTDLPQESYMEVFPCPAYTNLINLTSTCRYSHSMRTAKPVSHALLHFVRPVIWHGRGNTCHGCRLYMIEVSAHTRDRLPCYNFLRLLSQLEPSPEDWDTQHCPVRSGSVFTAVRAVNAMFCWEKDPMSTELEPLPGLLGHVFRSMGVRSKLLDYLDEQMLGHNGDQGKLCCVLSTFFQTANSRLTSASTTCWNTAIPRICNDHNSWPSRASSPSSIPISTKQ
jgi:hypothetical protein